MNDELGPEDRTLGTALSRAVEAQSVRETRFEDSRLGVNMNKPKRGSFFLPAFATVAAVLVGLFVGTTLLNRATAPSQVTTSPTPSAPAATRTPEQAIPTTARFVPVLVFFGRDGLPPVPGNVQSPEGPGTDAAGRVRDRVSAVLHARADEVPNGAVNALALPDGRSMTVGLSARVDGDLATVDIDISGGFPARGAAASQAALQQLVYTITEEPGIRRALITTKGQPAEIDQILVDKPLTREDVNGYDATIEERVVAEDEEVPATATTTISNETVAPALGRLAIELRGTPAPSGGFWSPRFSADLRRIDDASVPGKWVLQVTLPGVTDGRGNWTQDVEGTPIIQVRSTRVPAPNNQFALTYSISLSDARPWRVSVERGSAQGTMRVLVDIGGHTSAVANGTAVYSPRPAATVSRTFAVSGVARAFEATVSWRVRDSGGREVAKGFTNASMGSSPLWGTFTFQAQLPATVSGNVTLDVYQASPRDGSDTNKVEIPLQVR